MFEVSHVTKRYGKVVANDDISFSVADGQIAVLLGPNGAGKSTMLNASPAFSASTAPSPSAASLTNR